MTTKLEREEKINEGHWYEGNLADLLSEAEEAWSNAPSTGQWNTSIDVADLTRLVTEIRDRRSKDD